jgi:excinuclease ABC subunit A
MHMMNAVKKWIKIIGAREHNLKNVTVAIPKDSLTVVTGPSGSGKSSLVFDILHAEGQRRYMESLSSYARQFLGMPKKPEVDAIEGICPTIAIDQKTVGSNPRSTVGTITEIVDYLRILFARVGTAYCPDCQRKIQAGSAEHVGDTIHSVFAKKTVTVVAPLAIEKKGEFVHDLEKYFKEGYSKFIINGQRCAFRSLQEIQNIKLKKTIRHCIDLVVDTFEVVPEELPRLHEAVTAALSFPPYLCKVIAEGKEYLYSTERICLSCKHSFPTILEPRFFSFNSPMGACEECSGLGVAYRSSESFDDTAYEYPCEQCQGKRLHKLALAIKVGGSTIYDLGELSVDDLLAFFKKITLDDTEKVIAKKLLEEISNRLTFLCDVGLGYLSLNRKARTLSGGEGQRIRLATHIGSSLSGVLYLLDEPSIGLHQRDNSRFITTLKKLRDQGNTVVVVEHDIDMMLHADYIIDMGPAAGVHGGEIVAIGTPEEIMCNPRSLSGAYLSGRRAIQRTHSLRKPQHFLTIKNARSNNLKGITVQIPLGGLCGIAGVSGSGKSTLIMQELVPAVRTALKYKKSLSQENMGGIEHLDAMVVIDQSPIGRTSRSNPATYLGIFDDIRKLFASMPESNARGYKLGRFSFNVADGRCAHCNGDGSITVSMHFLPDVVMQCDRCKGLRYNAQTLEITFKGKHIGDILEMTAGEAVEFFKSHTSLVKKLRLLCDVGLDYMKIGQPSTTLSGGEAQRVKLVDELAKRGTRTLYILDEPTTGLHLYDIEKLLQVFERLIRKGNSLLVIEHNIDVLKFADHIIDLGPEGGREGGTVVAEGTPAMIADAPLSLTGAYLKVAL